MGLIKQNQFFIFWSLLGAISLGIIWHLPWRFQVNDDLIMMWLVSGAYTGQPETYAVFIHPFLSWIFSKAYTLDPNSSWYPLTWFLVLYLSFVLILKKLEALNSPTRWKHLLSFSFLIIGIHFCFFLQFTIVAGFASFASLLVLDNDKNSQSKPVQILAWFVLFLSFMIRWESVSLIIMGFLLNKLMFFTKSEFKSTGKFFFPLFVLVGLMYCSKIYFEQNSKYSEFLIFNKARSSVIDHPVFHEKIKSSQIKEGSEWFFFARWMFEDDKIDVSNLEEKKQELDGELYSVKQANQSLNRIISVQKSEAFKSFLGVLFVFTGLLLSKSKRKMVVFLGTWFLFMFVFNHFFILNGRVTILFFLVFLFPLLNYSNFPKYNPLIFITSFIVIAGLFTVHSLNFLEEAKGRKIMHQEFESLLGIIPKNELIILEGYMEHNFYFNYTQYNQVPILSLGWISRSPFQEKALKKFGVNKLNEAKHFSLIGIKEQDDSLYFPDYMDSIGGPFRTISVAKTPNLVLNRFGLK